MLGVTRIGGVIGKAEDDKGMVVSRGNLEEGQVKI